jgi:curved DNA-binding protein CbpA
MIYFNNVSGESEIKTRYKNLAKKYHPDLGGDSEIMKAINAEYEIVITGSYQAQGKSITEIEELLKKDKQAMEVLQAISGIDGIFIELCGVWLWVTGNTKDVKDKLKESSFKWSPKKKAWYWRPPEQKYRRYGNRYSLEEIRVKYGSESYKKTRQKIA